MATKGGGKIKYLLCVLGGVVAGALLMAAVSPKNWEEPSKGDISASEAETPKADVSPTDGDGALEAISTSNVEKPKDEISASNRVNFDKGNSWDMDSDEWNLHLTTNETPEQGITLVMNVLIPAPNDAKPSFEGRIQVLAVLLLGSKQEWAQSDSVVELVSSDFSGTVTIEGKRYCKAAVSIPFNDTVGANVNGHWTEGVPFEQVVKAPVGKVKIFFVGRRCSYAGDIAIQNPYFTYDLGSVDDGYSVNSTVKRNDATTLALSGNELVTESGGKVSVDWSKVSLVDQQATTATVKTYAYLKAVGASDHVIFGMEDEVWSKAGTGPNSLKGLTSSDVEDMTGSNAGVLGMDALSLTGQEFSAVRYNNSFAVHYGLPAIDLEALGTAAANVTAAAQVANVAIDRGAIVTLSCHMPNFTQVPEASDYNPEQDPSYAKYDFTAASARDQSGDPAHKILPGGACNDKFNAYLDMIADYASQVHGPILFRPFHEGAGEWFWWGSSGCDAATYQKLFQYTVEYLRDTKQVHNLIYVYSVDGDNTKGSADAYDKRYPGDKYVDVIGFDMYYKDPGADSGPWFSEFATEVTAAQQYASKHGKVFAVTEVGIMQTVPAQGDVATALTRTDNPEKQWFQKVLNVLSGCRASYFLTWTNNTEIFHVPYVKAVNEDGSLYGHEMIDGFLEFFNDKRSIFAANQREIVDSLCKTVSLLGHQVVNEEDPSRSYYYVVPAEQLQTVTSIEVTFVKDGPHYVWAASADGSNLDLPQGVYEEGTYVIPIPKGTSEIGFNVFTSEVDLLNLNIPGAVPAETSHSGRYLSVLGDSFSVSDAWRSKDNDKDAYTAVTKWWFAAAKAYGMNILVNNSVSATGIKLDSHKGAGDSGMVRCKSLHTAARTPDDIFVLMGVNDMFADKDFSVIQSEYEEMIASMKKSYPNASITLFTYPYVGVPSSGEDSTADIKALNDVIRKVAEDNDLGLVDLSECGVTAKNVGNYTRNDADIHYNRSGQELLGKAAVAGLKEIWD